MPHATLNPTDEQMAAYAQLRPGGPNFPHRSGGGDLLRLGHRSRHANRPAAEAAWPSWAWPDKTLILFSSDNGPEDIHIRNAGHSGVGSAGPFRGRKRSLYEGGVRVPFIVRWPGHVPAGEIDDTSVVAGCDLLPTRLQAGRRRDSRGPRARRRRRERHAAWANRGRARRR